jgi:isopentenyl diphosphate isomerase/L-lactate dehydrogenase-like FMN-dependent dehydrogenase
MECQAGLQRLTTGYPASSFLLQGEQTMAALDNCYNVFDLRDAAKRRLPKAVFEFVDRSTEDELALRNNRAAFEKIKLLHRSLVDVSERSTKTTLFGKELSLPMAIAPTGAAGLCWHEGELELAKAAARAKIPFTLATGAMTSMEKIAKEANFRLWFQLYVWKQRELSYQLIERAKNNGFEALIVTTDTIVPPNREYNAKNGFLLPFHPTWRFSTDIMQHPTWFATVLLKYFRTIGMPRMENYPDPYRRPITTDPGTKEVMRQDSLNWDDIRIFRDKWPGILMLKGINRVDDALKAISYGVDGLIVSNHGGRNMDSAAATIDMLPDIAEAVGDKATVILDSGVRRGSDIVKAVALGAKCVLTGRATLYGTAVGGEAGASKAVDIIQTEMDKTMAYTGCNRVDEISTDIFFGSRDSNRLMAV